MQNIFKAIIDLLQIIPASRSFGRVSMVEQWRVVAVRSSGAADQMRTRWPVIVWGIHSISFEIAYSNEVCVIGSCVNILYPSPCSQPSRTTPSLIFRISKWIPTLHLSMAQKSPNYVSKLWEFSSMTRQSNLAIVLPSCSHGSPSGSHTATWQTGAKC